MKPALLFSTLLSLSIAAHAQQWPRNAKTGKIEFRGILPWPDSVKTEAQRRALVRRWYATKLSGLTRAEAVQASEGKAKFTYDGLPQTVRYTYKERADKVFFLFSEAQLTATATGLAYQLTSFELGWFEEDVGDGAEPLEGQLKQVHIRPALIVIRKRLGIVLANW